MTRYLLWVVSVDPLTGYRYYSVSQLPRLNRILALKDLGFSLDQIEAVLNGGLIARRTAWYAYDQTRRNGAAGSAGAGASGTNSRPTEAN
ncbi:MAG: MerR family transcriptional regulator [Anaerolineae bacterium]